LLFYMPVLVLKNITILFYFSLNSPSSNFSWAVFLK